MVVAFTCRKIILGGAHRLVKHDFMECGLVLKKIHKNANGGLM